MNQELRGPDKRYFIAIEVLASAGGDTFRRYRTTTGVCARQHGQLAYLVVVEDACAFYLQPGDNGLLIRNLRLLNAETAIITAVITPGPGAPEWLPHESTCLLFNGDSHGADQAAERYIALDGMATERSWPSDDSTPLDRLAVAVGRSIARANTALTRVKADAGVALVAHVKVRIAVKQAEVVQGRMLLSVANPGEASNQFVEFTMTTAPASGDDDMDAEEGEE